MVVIFAAGKKNIFKRKKRSVNWMKASDVSSFEVVFEENETTVLALLKRGRLQIPSCSLCAEWATLSRPESVFHLQFPRHASGQVLL